MLSRFRSRALVQLSEQDAGARSANIALGCFASTEVAHSAVYHRMGDCHATQFSFRRDGDRVSREPMSRRRDGHFATGGQERKRSYTPATIAKKQAGNQAILNFPSKLERSC
jgi:hypothetical protein